MLGLLLVPKRLHRCRPPEEAAKEEEKEEAEEADEAEA
jgi:hypothetical protein